MFMLMVLYSYWLAGLLWGCIARSFAIVFLLFFMWLPSGSDTAREGNIMNLVHTFDHACLEHINVLCTWCPITDYPRVVTSMREGKSWTSCTFTFDRLDRVVLARWLHLQVIQDPLDKRSTFLSVGGVRKFGWDPRTWEKGKWARSSTQMTREETRNLPKIAQASKVVSFYACPRTPFYREMKGLLHSESTLESKEYS
jgi:hypothetical protein